MTTPDRNEPENFDWTAAEQDVADAEVVNLDAARDRRAANVPDNATPADLAADLDAEDRENGPVLVDSIAAQRRPRFTLAGFRDATRVPIVPSWLKSGAEFGGNLAWAAGFGVHALAYHGLR